MSEWRIWVMGDLQFMQEMLNGLAMIVGDAGFMEAVAIAFMVGAFIAAFGSIFSGNNQMPIGWAVGAGLLVAMGFSTTTTVHLEDARTNQFATVDNVPIAPAVAGSFTSHLGYYFTETFEQVFSYPSMTDAGLLSPMKGLQKTYGIDYREAGHKNGNADFAGSIVNYLASCTLRAVRVGDKTASELRNAANLWKEMRWQEANSEQNVEIQLDNGRQTEPCSTSNGNDDAHTILTNYRDNEFQDDFQGYLSDLMASTESDSNSGYSAGQPNGRQAIRDAIRPMLSGTGASVAPMVHANNMALMNLMPEAMRHYSGNLNQNIQEMGAGFQAPAQRNYQWAAEGSIFQDTVLPMLTFMEAFVYAIAPFAAVALAIGPAGAGIVGKYGLTALWIQSWMPVFAVINLYYMVILERFGSQLISSANQSNAVAPSSIRGTLSSQAQIQDWISTAGLLQASVPGLTMLIIYGTSVSAAHMSSRLNAGENIDPNATQRTQDVAGGSPAFDSLGAAMTQNRGNTSVGAGVGTGTSMGASTALGNAVSARQTQMSQQQEKTTEAAQSVFSNAWSHSQSASQGQGLRERTQAVNGRTESVMDSYSHNIASELTEKGQVSENLQAATKAGLGLSIGGSTGISGELQNQYDIGADKANQIADKVSETTQNNDEFKADFSEAVSHDVEHGTEETFAKQAGKSEQQTLSQESSRMESVEQSYNKTEELASQLEGQREYSGQELAHMVKANPNGGISAFNDSAGQIINGYDSQTDADLTQQRDARSQMIQEVNPGMSNDEAKAVANAEVLSGVPGSAADDLAPGDRAKMASAGGQLINDATMGQQMKPGSAYTGSSTVNEAQENTPDDLNGPTNVGDELPDQRPGTTQESVNQGRESVAEQATDSGQVNSHNEQGREAVNDQQGANRGRGNEQQREQARENIQTIRNGFDSTAGEAAMGYSQVVNRISPDGEISQEQLQNKGEEKLVSIARGLADGETLQNAVSEEAMGALQHFDEHTENIKQEYGVGNQTARLMAYEELGAVYGEEAMAQAVGLEQGRTDRAEQIATQDIRDSLTEGMSDTQVGGISTAAHMNGGEKEALMQNVATLDGNFGGGAPDARSDVNHFKQAFGQFNKEQAEITNPRLRQ
jgi:hypothetical protein